MCIKKCTVIILCEDQAQNFFIRCVLEKMNWNGRFRSDFLPKGSGCGFDHVLKNFCTRLDDCRKIKKEKGITTVLIAMVDGDKVSKRQGSLDNLRAYIQQDDNALLLCAERNIEDWVKTLLPSTKTTPDGLEKFDDYKEAARILARACEDQQRISLSSSLKQACHSYKNAFEPMRNCPMSEE